MKFNDFIELSVSNLWRMKLRAALTISGIVIAIAAFVTMLSFSAGNQKYISDQFNQFGLFTTIQVYPENKDKDDATKTVPLDNDAINLIAKIPGVNLVYPYDRFDIMVKFDDTTFSTKAKTLSLDVFKTTFYSKFISGQIFSNDTAHEVIVTNEFLNILKLNDHPDSIMGKYLILSVKNSSLDSGVINMVSFKDMSFKEKLKEIDFDSISNSDYRNNLIQTELNEGLKRFIEGFSEHQLEISDTLKIVGIVDQMRSHRMRSTPIIINESTARKFNSTGFRNGNDPTAIFSALKSGTLFSVNSNSSSNKYTQVTVDYDPYVPFSQIKDSIKTLGFRVFSYAEAFKEVQQIFIYFNFGLGIIGLIALTTAALGIVNTMIMSILERKREIGILKSLGADIKEIKMLFIVESGLIGAIGSSVGIFVGWVSSRILSAIVIMFMEQNDIPGIDLFALPLWLILVAFFFGLIVSLFAGYYPASRAAKLDPVEALRSD